MRSARSSVVANPVLVGATTVLVVVVAVFLAYNANNGLPFVPTRALEVDLPNGANLVVGNEVRSGGYRVGVVEEMRPVRLPSGGVGARLSLKLDRKLGAVPEDSTVTVRPRSALGLKYVELTTGRSRRMLPDGATLPVDRARVPVELDQFYNTFDTPTREASAENLDTFGSTLSGRGADLATTIARAPSLFGHLSPVMRTLADPRTDLKGFFRELGDTARVVAGVSAADARQFTSLATTFDAISRDPEALRQTISKTPGTFTVATRSLRVQRPFLEHTAALSVDLEAAARELRRALPPVNRALAVGVPVTRRTTQLYSGLRGSLGSLQRLAAAPTTIGALRGLTATVATLQPQLRFLGPYVTVCNSWNFFWTLAAEHLSSPDATGSEQRALLNSGKPTVPGVDSNDSIESDNANEFAHGKVSSVPGATEQQLHGTFYGSAIDDQGRANCEAGQQGYVNSANPFRDRSGSDPYKNVAVDHPVNPHSLRVGPTFKRLDRNGHGIGLNPATVPAGETFTSRPGGTGADIPLLSSYPPGVRR